MNIPAQNPSVPAINPSELSVIDGLVTTSSLHVAAHFGKRHDDVLKRIRALDCSTDFRLRNFAEASQDVEQPKGGVAKYPVIRMTRDGFTFLCMGFTGKQAAKWKEAYINAFNQLEQQLQAPVPAASPFNNARVLVAFGANGQVISQPVAPDAFLLRAEQLPELVADPAFLNAADLVPLALAALRRIEAAGGTHAVRNLLAQLDDNYLLVLESELILSLYGSPAIWSAAKQRGRA